jgi:hypothetical protein
MEIGVRRRHSDVAGELQIISGGWMPEAMAGHGKFSCAHASATEEA